MAGESGDYRTLCAGFREVALLEESLGLLEWDSAVLMPHGAAGRRAAQMATLEGVIYDKKQGLAEFLADADPGDDPWDRANLAEMQRSIARQLRVPKALHIGLSEAKQVCEIHWRRARADDDFAAVEPYLTRVVAMSREALAAQCEADDSLLDTAIAAFEPGLKASRAEDLLEGHGDFIRNFFPVAAEKSRIRRARHSDNWSLAVDRQAALVRTLCGRLGLTPETGRIDTSTHPFSAGYPGDARITVRYQEDHALSSVCAAIHEAGHALYEMGLPSAWNDQPVGRARGMVLQESQSLCLEMQAGRSADFLGWLHRHLAEAHGIGLDRATLEAECWQVAASPIRVEADEVTYPLHILLRFRLERNLLAGKIAVSDLPEAFRAEMTGLLEIGPPSDREGVLQDIHWYIGGFGYFPCYALGAMAAAQLFAALRHQVPEIPDQLGRGDFTTLKSWLESRIHRQGCLYDSDTLMERATGSRLEATALQTHLLGRYG